MWKWLSVCYVASSVVVLCLPASLHWNCFALQICPVLLKVELTFQNVISYLESVKGMQFSLEMKAYEQERNRHFVWKRFRRCHVS